MTAEKTILADYTAGKISYGKAAELLDKTLWEMEDVLKKHGLDRFIGDIHEGYIWLPGRGMSKDKVW